MAGAHQPNQLHRLNRAMAYIEDHLDGEIDYERVAQIAGCSAYHFRRTFSFLSGMGLAEYVRGRRLSQAALALRAGPVRVIDLAVTYGYESADAFSRAFQALHGLTPTAARAAGAALKAIPPMTFRLSIEGGDEMDYRIVEKEAFHVVGITRRVALQYEGVNPEIAAMWASLTPEDISTLKALSDVEPRGLISASVNFSEGRAEGSGLDQYIGAARREAVEGERWAVLPVAAGTWGVFTARGPFPETLQQVWARIYAEWFAMSGYEVAPGPELLWNADKDTSRPDFHSEIWVPITRP